MSSNTETDELTISGPSTHVYTFRSGGRERNFRAWDTPQAVIVDIRLFGRDGTPDQNRLVFRPEALEGIPADVIESARHSNPPGFAVVRRKHDA
jgi:hypothetical protein